MKRHKEARAQSRDVPATPQPPSIRCFPSRETKGSIAFSDEISVDLLANIMNCADVRVI
jgi:hypothetical protein